MKEFGANLVIVKKYVIQQKNQNTLYQSVELKSFQDYITITKSLLLVFDI